MCADPECATVHSMSFASGGRHLPAGTQRWYGGSSRWFQSSHGTVFETDLLRQLNVQMLHSHSAWEAFAREYAMLHGGDAQTVVQLRRPLSHAWLAWSLLDWCDELRVPLGDVDLSSDEGLDAVLLDWHDKLLSGFVFKWGTEHSKHCRQPESCVAYILDGHFKCRRIVCAWTRARLVRVTGLKSELVLGCLKRPLRGSRFCGEHSQRSACRSDTPWQPEDEPVVRDVDYSLPEEEEEAAAVAEAAVEPEAAEEELPPELTQPWLPTVPPPPPPPATAAPPPASPAPPATRHAAAASARRAAAAVVARQAAHQPGRGAGAAGGRRGVRRDAGGGHVGAEGAHAASKADGGLRQGARRGAQRLCGC